MSSYPEHDKLHEVAEVSQAIGEFFDWLESKHIYLGEYSTYDDGRERQHMHQCHRSITSLLAEHFNIDRDALEREKRAMLEEVREASRQRVLSERRTT